ncbi:MAG: hypothetical protein JWR26_2236 [Pedosphaera sp.]|nr:hypothetical protein [Pedosphaera sp.]
MQLGGFAGRVHRILASLTLALILAGARHLSAGQLPGNIWPNPTLESDSNSDGVPDFWNRGGSSTLIDLWITSSSVSPSHSFQLNDTSTNSYGEWYSDQLNIAGGANYLLRYNLRYIVTNIGPMRVTVNFYDSSSHLLTGVTYAFSGMHDFWEEITQQFTTPTNATRLGLSFTSGGGLNVTGQAWLDDISMAAATNSNSLIPYIENFPSLPNPLVIRNWRQTALDYHNLAFNPSITGQFLPLLHEYTANTLAGYSGPAFGLPSYVGNPADSGEAVSVLGAVLGGTLAGLNMAALNGKDRVQQCEVFYSVVNGHGLVLNNVNSQGSGSAWYDIFPSMLFYEIGSRYPGRATYQTKMRAIADSWLTALPVLSNNFDHTDFNFQTMTPVNNGSWNEPDMAIGIAWLEYMAYVQFQDAKYLTAADGCMAQMNLRSLNPYYETLAFFGAPLASRMNAELGRSYSTTKHLNWIFTASSDARPGWGCDSARWGNYDAYGLIGSTTDSSGYAFSMNSYTAAGIIAPVVRYEPRYARLLGRWLLHIAANSDLFYPDTLPTNMQASASWVQQTGVQSISYEGVRHLGVTTPYATGDATSPIQDLNPYGTWGSGWMGALFRTSNVPGILQIDCVASEAFPPPALPSYLLYNPYGTAQLVSINVGSSTNHLYDEVAGAFIATNVTGNVVFTIPPDSAVVVVQCPAAGTISQAGQKLLVGGIVIDYWNAAHDTDGDGLPDWWESRYYGNSTNVLPQTTAANGFSNLYCYRLGLDPTNPRSTFRLQAAREPGTGNPQLTWNSVGGKTYSVEYANNLSSPGAFIQALTVTETNVPPGVESTRTFVDDFTLTGGPPGANGRYYRVRWVGP